MIKKTILASLFFLNSISLAMEMVEIPLNSHRMKFKGQKFLRIHKSSTAYFEAYNTDF